MSATNGSAMPNDGSMELGKEKGKATVAGQGQNPDMSMDEDEEDSSDGEESGVEEDPNTEAAEEPDEDNMEEIDTSNILGRRTRGKAIDYAQAAQKAKEAGDPIADEDEDDEDEDQDFEVRDQSESGIATRDQMED